MARPRKKANQPARRPAKRPSKHVALATPETVTQIADLLAETWPDAVVELDHTDAYQLLVATILAAQSTDKLINTITPAVFAKYPDATALAGADRDELETLVRRSGYYRTKAGYLIGVAQACVARHGGEIPRTMEELCALPGVARKTANVVLGEAMNIQAGICVDTHVTRLSQRLGLSANTDPVKIEQDLMKVVPQPQWTKFAQRLIWHGRRVCDAKAPDCEHCVLAPLCPSAFKCGLKLERTAAKTAKTAKTANRAKQGNAAKTAKTAKTAANRPARGKPKPKPRARARA
jgi:endonuclease III